MGRIGRALAFSALACALAAGGCVTEPKDQGGTSERAARMKADCERRGGIWYPVERSCAGADPVLR